MPTVAQVRLRYAPHGYWFDPCQTGAKEGDHVLVETTRGQEIGLCTAGAVEVEQREIKKPLKDIVRVATEEDLAKAQKLAERGKAAMSRYYELVGQHELDMSPVAVEFMFDERHATFYFTADDRVDFRELVRDLANEFHVRVDMRQIGVRDEARAVGGLGPCGEELCCARMGGDFQAVTIRMAKEQDLPLNPAKISGLCGRLMCCLRYEYDTYKDFKSRAPKKNALIETPEGLAKVVEFDTPRETVQVRMEDGTLLALPLSSLDTGDKEVNQGEHARPCHISKEKFDKIVEDLNKDKMLAMMGAANLSIDDIKSAKPSSQANSEGRKPRRRRRGGSSGAAAKPQAHREPAETQTQAHDQRKRRRSVSATGGEQAHTPTAKQDATDKPAKSTNKSRRRRGGGSKGNQSQAANSAKRNAEHTTAVNAQRPSKPRPGQHSSTVSGDAANEKPKSSNQGSGSGSKSNRKKRRRRSSSGSKSNATSSQDNAKKSGE